MPRPALSGQLGGCEIFSTFCQARLQPYGALLLALFTPKGLPKVRLTAQLLGTRAERMSTYSGMLPTNIATERPASDQASKKATRAPPSALFPRRFHHDPTLQHYRLPDVTASVTNLVLTYQSDLQRVNTSTNRAFAHKREQEAA
jgi:hypothetical protein